MTIPKHLMEAKLCNKDTCAEVEQLNSLVNSCQKEIRRLKEENQRLKKDIKIKEGLHETTFKNLMEARRENQRLNNVLNELKWKPIEEYKKSKYDWVLVKYFDKDYECVPCVAEKRWGKWYSESEMEIQFDVKYFFDMQQLDKLNELKESDK